MCCCLIIELCKIDWHDNLHGSSTRVRNIYKGTMKFVLETSSVHSSPQNGPAFRIFSVVICEIPASSRLCRALLPLTQLQSLDLSGLPIPQEGDWALFADGLKNKEQLKST